MSIVLDNRKNEIYLGSFVKVFERSETLRFGDPEEEAIHESCIGRIAIVGESPYSKSEDIPKLLSPEGEVFLEFVHLGKNGIQSISLYAQPDKLEVVDATEELVILYSPELGQLLAPFGEPQTSPTFKRLVDKFGLYDI